MNTALVKCTYKQFQSEQRLVIEEGTKQDGSFTVVVFGKPKTISLDSMLVTADDSNGGANQLRDIDDVGDNINGFIAVVCEECSLKNKLKAELKEMGYSNNYQ